MAKDWVNEWLLLTRKMKHNLPEEVLEVRPPLKFAKHDLILSIQASEFHYSQPRDNTGPYTMVEVGLMHGKLPHELTDYADTDYADTETTYVEGLALDDGEDVNKYPLEVCGYVPVGAVNAIINRLGGIK